ncbi:MAG: tetratricopeptide repeat protein, partial [Kiritimatiellaeota bacterium]|nr:tetratricopeptide repeat protein [Kiritimatiellota bacterium]
AFLLQQLPEYRDNLAFALMNVGMALPASQNYVNAAECLSRVVLIMPNNHLAHLRLGQVHQAMGQTDLARSHYRKALDLSPKFTPARKALEALQ